MEPKDLLPAMIFLFLLFFLNFFLEMIELDPWEKIKNRDKTKKQNETEMGPEEMSSKVSQNLSADVMIFSQGGMSYKQNDDAQGRRDCCVGQIIHQTGGCRTVHQWVERFPNEAGHPPTPH